MLKPFCVTRKKKKKNEIVKDERPGVVRAEETGLSARPNRQA